MAVAVPKGNRQAILVNASRADFGGDLEIGASRAARRASRSRPTRWPPASAPIPSCSPPRPTPRWPGRWRRLSGKPVDPKVKVPSEFSQTAELVLGQNNVPFWTRTVDTLAVAVTEEAPYSIEVVEPKVPAGPRRLDGPEGRGEAQGRLHGRRSRSRCPGTRRAIGSAGGVAIPEEQNEAVIPINADGGAELKTWKIVVNGSSSAPTGPIMVSSQLANLTIAAQLRRRSTFQAASVEQGKGRRPGRQGGQGGRLRGRGDGHR